MIQALHAMAVEQVADPTSDVVFGWFALVVPVAAFAIRGIIRAFTAETWVLRDCGQNIQDVRDVALTSEIRPTLAAIVVAVHPYVDLDSEGTFLPGEPGNPENEVQRVLAYRATTFSTPVAKLEEHYANVHRAACVHGRRVAHARRAGVAMAVFLLGWIYVGVLLVFPQWSEAEGPLIPVVAVLGVSLGWASAEWLASNRENNHLSTLARVVRAKSQGETR